MSADAYRLFRHTKGYTVSVSQPKMIGYYVTHPEYTEVQVVPLDAVVIDGPLPEVKGGGWDDLTVGRHTFAPFDDIDDAREYLRAVAAVVARLREHPPVEEAQVKALADVIRHWGILPTEGEESWEQIARRLYGRGVRVEGATS